MYDYLIKNGYDVQPLSRGSFKGIPFEEGGGFKVNWGGDRILQYHPENLSHQNILIELGFKIEFVGEKQYQYLVYNNCYCKITYLEKLNAFVIESADNLTDAMNGVLEDGDLYYMNISEDAMLHQLRRDVVAYYMD